MKKRLRTILAPIIVVVTVGAFVYYIKKHPGVLSQLAQLSPWSIVLLLGIYSAAFFVYLFITRVSLGMYHKIMPLQEQFLFNAYSSLINFFGPGQSGPIFRGAYLKKRHDLSIKQFSFTFLLYLAFYAVISAMLVVVGSRPWWQTALVMVVVGVVSWFVVRQYKQRTRIGNVSGLNAVNLGWLLLLVAGQITLLAVTYGIELHSVNADASLGQVLSYTGVSNFSLFVALTPGAIGIREAFLVFSQNLHGISSSSIVAANLIDRAVYLIFLGVLFGLVIVTHTKDKLRVSQLKTDTKQTGDI